MALGRARQRAALDDAERPRRRRGVQPRQQRHHALGRRVAAEVDEDDGGPQIARERLDAARVREHVDLLEARARHLLGRRLEHGPRVVDAEHRRARRREDRRRLAVRAADLEHAVVGRHLRPRQVAEEVALGAEHERARLAAADERHDAAVRLGGRGDAALAADVAERARRHWSAERRDPGFHRVGTSTTNAAGVRHPARAHTAPHPGVNGCSCELNYFVESLSRLAPSLRAAQIELSQRRAGVHQTAQVALGARGGRTGSS